MKPAPLLFILAAAAACGPALDDPSDLAGDGALEWGAPAPDVPVGELIDDGIAIDGDVIDPDALVAAVYPADLDDLDLGELGDDRSDPASGDAPALDDRRGEFGLDGAAAGDDGDTGDGADGDIDDGDIDAGAGADGVAGPDEGGVDTAVIAAAGPAAGSKMITKRYAAFHRSASTSSSLLSVPPHNGVHDSGLHRWGNHNGVVPPGHTVRLKSATAHHGFYKVSYEGKTGWIAKSKLLWKNPALSRVHLALKSPNTFFKNQLHRARFNKDGPSTSGNCAPTSLAMAALVLGSEPAGLSVEQSIHRVRHKYDPGLHETTGTTRAQIQSAAAAIGLHVHGLTTALRPSAALARVAHQLSLGHLVVLTGQPGKAGATPTAYQKRFNQAYAAALADGQSLVHSRYTFDGHHAILVLGRTATGRYVVGDPISEVGFVSLTGAQLKDFMARFGGGTGNAVWR